MGLPAVRGVAAAKGMTRPVTHISLIQNWFDELKAKVPVKR
jgi:hypothetical protein